MLCILKKFLAKIPSNSATWRKSSSYIALQYILLTYNVLLYTMTFTLVKKYSLALFGLMIVVVICNVHLRAQSLFDRVKFDLGYTASFVVGDNPALQPLLIRNTDSARNEVNGSSVVGGQSGISVRASVTVDSAQRFIVPIGVDLMFIRGSQRLESIGQTGREFALGSASQNITSFFVGGNYKFWDLKLASAYLYAGVEARGSIVPGSNFTYIAQSYQTGREIFRIDTTMKPTVFRVGGSFRIGVQGVIDGPLSVNINAVYGVLNLFGRDLRATGRDRRGELLTPSTLNETGESIVQFTQFAIWFQYRF